MKDRFNASEFRSGARDLACPSCRGIEMRYIGRLPLAAHFAGTKINSGDAGELFRCLGCELWFRFPRMEKRQRDVLYRQAGQFGLKGDGSRADEREDWNKARDAISNKHGGKVLDVGCANGQFLGLLSDSWEKFGVEINNELAGNAKNNNVNIIGTDIESISTDVKFDLITAFDVIEHLDDPRIFLSQCAKLLTGDGLMLISTGNTDAWTWKLFGSRYWYCANAEHISFIGESWCHRNVQYIGLELVNSISIRHRKVGLLRASFELLGNVIYFLFPPAIGLARRIGFGGIQGTSKEALLFPPGWESAKDHILIVLKKRDAVFLS